MKKRRGSRGVACFFLLAAVIGCQRKPPTVSGAAKAENPGDDARNDLVLEPMAGWTPEDAALKLSLQLISEKSSVVTGGKFRYRMEIRNVGRDQVVFNDPSPSFIKDGSLCGSSGFSFSVTSSAGAEQALPCDSTTPTAPGSGLALALKPGEYLLTRPEGPGRRFRELRTAFHFEKPGTYRIKAVYSVPGLRAESNAVVFDVLKFVKPGQASDKRATHHSEGAAPTEKKHE